MKQMLFTLLLAATSLTAAADTLTVAKLFRAMPDSIIPYLSRNNRLDFIDFMESKMKAEVTNSFGGKSQMTALGPDSLVIRMNESCTLVMLLLDTTDDVDSCRQVIAVVRTLGIGSDVRATDPPQYFSAAWRRLESEPVLTDLSRKRLLGHIKDKNILKIITDKLNKH